MPFSLSNWLLRKRINARAQMSHRPMEHSRIVNPYHSISIEPGPKSCKAVRLLEDRRILASSAPRLPLPECTGPASCKCHYAHHNDRRSRQDRRVQPHNPHAHEMSERRSGAGRRMSD